MTFQHRGLVKRVHTNGTFTWYIDKRVRRFGRLCETTGTADEEEAGRYLAHRLDQIRRMLVYGERPRRTFREATAHYLKVNAAHKRISRDALALRELDPYIGTEWIDAIHDDSFTRYRRARRTVTASTRNRTIGVARRVLTQAARLWTYPRTSLTWLAEVPLIVMEKEVHARQAYPLDWYEQDLLLGELTTTVARMARFDVSTGLRDQEVCGLEWAWERRVPDLDAGGMRRSIFVLPAWVTKNAEARIVVLNDEAQALLEEVRGEHPVYVFTHQHHRRRRTRYSRLNSTGWRNARARAAARYQEEQGQEAPEGFRCVRVQDLRHTFGRRLRAVGVSLEDRKALLGHKDREITPLQRAGDRLPDRGGEPNSAVTPRSHADRPRGHGQSRPGQSTGTAGGRTLVIIVQGVSVTGVGKRQDLRDRRPGR